MKPYGMTTDHYGDTGCCPGHDEPFIRKWSGKYSSNQWRRVARLHVKKETRRRRHEDKRKLQNEIRELLLRN